MTQLTPNRDTEVAIVQQGILSSEDVNIVINGTGTKVGQITVPAGKKWLIKNMSARAITGTYTITKVSIVTTIDSNEISWIEAPYVYPVTFVNIGEQGIIFSAGQIINCYASVSGYTANGNYQVRLCYIELDD